jgi:hypothetical protein
MSFAAMMVQAFDIEFEIKRMVEPCLGSLLINSSFKPERPVFAAVRRRGVWL